MASATPLVLLPGMMCDARLWRAQIAEFEASRPVLSPVLDGGETVAAIAAKLLAGLPGRFAVAGLSMGGILAFELFRQAPERLERLALLDTNFRADAPERAELRDRQIAEVRGGGLARVLRDELKPNYLAAVHRGNSELLDEVLAMGLDLGEENFVAQSKALQSRPDCSDLLGTIDCPTLVLCGAEDALCPPALHREMSLGIPGSALHIIDDCGHLSPMEQPAKVTNLLRDWLDQ